ncbi:MAG: hypothetical protein KZQ83_17765 [gamma proteobacterium symbiont of Taylorina sp.]|nr:hypothetical protein [gamma proteobacterium symbiont of Taylorina sp.]
MARLTLKAQAEHSEFLNRFSDDVHAVFKNSGNGVHISVDDTRTICLLLFKLISGTVYGEKLNKQLGKCKDIQSKINDEIKQFYTQ